MRRERGAGTVVRIGKDWYARRRTNGSDIYGPARASREEAEEDRLKWAKTPAKPQPRTRTPSLREWAVDCLESSWGQSQAPETFSTNETHRHTHLNPSALGKMRVDRIERRHCQAFVDGLIAHDYRYIDGVKTATSTRPAAPATKRRVVAFVSKILSMAVDAGMISANPMAGIELPKLTERDNRVLDPSEAMLLLNPTTRIAAMALVGMLCGMRRSEVCRLQWSDVRGENLRVPGKKTRTSDRIVPLPSSAADAIKLQPKRGKFVFTTEKGTPVQPDRFTEDFAELKKTLGLPTETRLQDLRGSFVSLLIETGADLRTVMELAGHADPRTTMKAYARARTPAKVAAMNRLVDAIGLEDRVSEAKRKPRNGANT